MLRKLNDLIAQQQIQNVLIIDDAYDTYPLAEDLVNTVDWENFFDDLSEQQKQQISNLYPQYMEMSTEDVIDDNDFIKTIWDIFIENKNIHPFSDLFSQFEKGKKSDIQFLSQLSDLLTELNLNVTTCGRNQLSNHNQFDIIITDLFLDVTKNDFEASIEKVRKLFEIHNKPPLLILMSRSFRLDEKSKEFRDKTGSLESMFRFIEKKELTNSNKLYRILNDLIENREHSQNLLNFINNWDRGIQTAAKKCIDILKTLDIADFTKIKQLMLNAEGELTSNYMMDVMHYVLQYELENQKSIIDSSIPLNNIQSQYLPQIRKNTNLQEIVERMHCKNNINIPNFSENRIYFGDILTINNLKKIRLNLKIQTLEETDVILAISPACDLQRCDESYNLLFLKGTKEKFTIRAWIPKAESSKIVKINNEFYIINWDTKNPFTFPYKYLKKQLVNGSLIISGRLRETVAISLQQESLAKVGRIGLIAPMPASYHLEVSFFYFNSNGELENMNIDRDESCFSTIYTSHRTIKNNALNKLIISNEFCEKLHQAIDKINPNNIHRNSQKAFKLIKEELYLEELIKKDGIQAPIIAGKHCPIKVCGTTIGYVTTKMDETIKNKKDGLIICLNTD